MVYVPNYKHFGAILLPLFCRLYARKQAPLQGQQGPAELHQPGDEPLTNREKCQASLLFRGEDNGKRHGR